MILSPFPSGSLRTSQGALKTMVARVSAVYVGQCGRPPWFGFPVRAKLTQAVLICLLKTYAAGSPAP
jgi:hypothetical protein